MKKYKKHRNERSPHFNFLQGGMHDALVNGLIYKN